jgi:2-methylcitrate dehydratase
MTQVEQLARFVTNASYADLSETARQQLKIRIVDSLACAIGALAGEPIQMIHSYLRELGGAPRCALIAAEQRTSPERAAFYNSALVRYLDYNDSYLAVGESCHPSDNLGAVLAAAEYAGRDGRDLLAALAVAYQVQCRLSEVAPVRAKGFDHTTQGSYAVVAGVAKALGLDPERTAHAIAISGTAFNALRVTRTGRLSHWKGLAYPNIAFAGTHAVLLAKQGITGPLEVFEGNKGFMESIAGPFAIDWSQEDLERVTRTILKKYNAEVHSQSAIEGILELRQQYDLSPEEVEGIDIEIFDVAYHIIGGGEEGDKTVVRTKEQADHSLPYIVAVALIDGHMLPAQYQPERILRSDVQDLLKKVTVRPMEALSRRFPEEMPCRLIVKLKDGRELSKEKQDYEGFHSRPMQWETVAQKFHHLSEPYTDTSLRHAILEAVSHLERISVTELTQLLSQVKEGIPHGQ